MFGIAAQQLSRAAPRVASRSVGCRGGAIFVGIVEELGLIRVPLTIYLWVARSCRDSEYYCCWGRGDRGHRKGNL